MPSMFEKPLCVPLRRSDGAALWRIAEGSRALDLNSPYAYLLWCRDFSETSMVSLVGGEVAGFVLGYRRPSRLDTLMVWQIAVESDHCGKGIAGALLDALVARLVNHEIRFLEATITPTNAASERLFLSFARRWRAPIERDKLFSAEEFPAGQAHADEYLYRIGPLVTGSATTTTT